MNIKGFVNAVLYGAAASLGGFIINKGIQSLSNPYKKAKLKKNIKNIKYKIVKKAES